MNTLRPLVDLAQNKIARITGGFYLAFILASVLADGLGHIGLGDADQVYQAIVTNEGRFRLGLVVALMTGFLFLMAAWGLYVLLTCQQRPGAALLGAQRCWCRYPGCEHVVAGIRDATGRRSQPHAGLLGGTTGGAGLPVDQRLQDGLGHVPTLLRHLVVPLGYLVYKSGFLPRFLGALLMLDGVAVLIWFLQALLLPDHPAIRYPGLAVSLVAEVGLALWLLVKGVKVDRPGADLPGASRLRVDPAGSGATGRGA